MIAFADRIRKIAALLNGGQLHPVEVRIFFGAPNPRNPGSKTLTIDKDKAKEANFQWQMYRLLFSVDQDQGEPKYYIYSVGLDTTGKEKLPNIVFESDSNWSYENVDDQTKDMNPGDAVRAFPSLLKGPKLFPPGTKTVYVNSDKSDPGDVSGEGKHYSSQDFKRYFDNNFYVVLNPKSQQLLNPFGQPIGASYTAGADLDVLETLANASPTDAFHTCTVCGKTYSSQCKCRYSDMSCPNGHRWSICPVHKKRVEGVTGHDLNLGFNVCTCNLTSGDA